MRQSIRSRPDWQAQAARLGFDNHTYAGVAYWCDDACYRLAEYQITHDLKPAIEELWAMCLQVVDRACRDDAVLRSLHIPEIAWDALRDSWRSHQPPLCTRFDLAYSDGAAPKLHDCNGDTPGTLFESAAFQWIWFEDQMANAALDSASDQFNRLHEALVEAFAALPAGLGPIHVVASSRNIEDQVLARYLRDCAHQAQRRTDLLPLEAIGVDPAGNLVDRDDHRIGCLIKVYRWELLLRETFGSRLLGPSAPLVAEPLWKLVLSSKGLLVWLWRLFPRHPNLLACWFADDDGIDVGDRYAVKPLFSIKGANVRLVDPSLPGGSASTPGPYGREGHVIQTLHRLPRFSHPGGHSHASVLGWIVGGRAEGIGVMEADGPIIHDPTSRFVPHIVLQ